MKLTTIPLPAMNAPHPTAPSSEHKPVQLRGTDLQLLASLDVLLQEHSVTRAAERLHLSQPALSAQLSRLRQIFNDPLLIPMENGRGFVPSQFAFRLHSRLQPALVSLAAAVQLPREAFDPATVARHFRIAASNTAAALVLPLLAKRFSAVNNPRLKLAAAEPDFSRLAGDLEKTDFDVYIGPACLLPPDLASVTLASTPMMLVQRRHHPRGAEPLTLDAYCALDHINVALSASLHGVIDEHLYRLGKTRQVTMALRDYSPVPGVLLASDLVCAVPASMAEAWGPEYALATLPFAYPPYVLCMAWHPRNEACPGLRWLRDQIVAATQGIGAG